MLFYFAFYAADANNAHTWLLRSLLARAPYVVLFDLKLLIKDGNVAGIYVLCAHMKKILGSPQNTPQRM